MTVCTPSLWSKHRADRFGLRSPKQHITFSLIEKADPSHDPKPKTNALVVIILHPEHAPKKSILQAGHYAIVITTGLCAQTRPLLTESAFHAELLGGGHEFYPCAAE